MPQRIIFPWDIKNWHDIKEKIDQNISSVINLDSIIANIHMGKIKLLTITAMVNAYNNDNNYIKDKIPESVIIGTIVPLIQSLILDGPKVFRRTNLYVLNDSSNVTITRHQIAVIIACMWFDLFNYRYIERGDVKIEDMPILTYINIFTEKNIFAFHCILIYFLHIHKIRNNDEFNQGVIIVSRKLVTPPDWKSCNDSITKFYIGANEDGTPAHIDDSPAKMQTCFCSEIIGGDLFSGTLTHEETIFLIRPETIIVSLLCPKIQSCESVTVFGAEKISQYSGYGGNIKHIGEYNDTASFSVNREIMRQTAVIFMDASPKTSHYSQIEEEFDRDLNKAYCAFTAPPVSKTIIATGNWIVGVYAGNIYVKFIQQLLAVSASGHEMVYYSSFREFEEEIEKFVNFLHLNNITVCQLYKMYKTVIKKYYKNNQLKSSEFNVFRDIIDMY